MTPRSSILDCKCANHSDNTLKFFPICLGRADNYAENSQQSCVLPLACSSQTPPCAEKYFQRAECIKLSVFCVLHLLDLRKERFGQFQT